MFFPDTYCPYEPTLVPEDAASETGVEARKLSPEDKGWLAGRSPRIWLLYLGLKKRLFAWDEPGAVTIRNSVKNYVAFGSNWNTFLAVFLQGLELRIVLNVKGGNLANPDGLAECLVGKRHLGTGDWRVTIADDSDLDRVLPLLRQAFDLAKAKRPRKPPKPVVEEPVDTYPEFYFTQVPYNPVDWERV